MTAIIGTIPAQSILNMPFYQLFIALYLTLFSGMGAVRASAFISNAVDGSPSLVITNARRHGERRGCRSIRMNGADRATRLQALRAQEPGDIRRLNRRGLFWLLPSAVLASAIATQPRASLAADGTVASSSQQQPGATIWITGKPPRVPGAKPRDKNDVSGTRKDPSFLRSIADCKNKCENVPAADGLSKSKEECLSECQDICCTTYEQCTFAIVPRI
jgi:hypothetical protein